MAEKETKRFKVQVRRKGIYENFGTPDLPTWVKNTNLLT
jgi:hypothetical protein